MYKVRYVLLCHMSSENISFSCLIHSSDITVTHQYLLRISRWLLKIFSLYIYKVCDISVVQGPSGLDHTARVRRPRWNLLSSHRERDVSIVSEPQYVEIRLIQHIPRAELSLGDFSINSCPCNYSHTNPSQMQP